MSYDSLQDNYPLKDDSVYQRPEESFALKYPPQLQKHVVDHNLKLEFVGQSEFFFDLLACDQQSHVPCKVKFPHVMLPHQCKQDPVYESLASPDLFFCSGLPREAKQQVEDHALDVFIDAHFDILHRVLDRNPRDDFHKRLLEVIAQLKAVQSCCNSVIYELTVEFLCPVQLLVQNLTRQSRPQQRPLPDLDTSRDGVVDDGALKLIEGALFLQ